MSKNKLASDLAASGLGETLLYRADWSIYLPAILVILLYGALWVLMLFLGKGDTALARILLLVLVLGVPLLLVRAFLRYMSFELRIFRRRLLYRRGWIRPRWRRVALEDVTGVRVAYGPAGRLPGSGALIMTFHAGPPLRLMDIADPEGAEHQISRRLRVLKSRSAPI